DGVKAVSRRRRWRAAPALRPANHRATSKYSCSPVIGLSCLRRLQSCLRRLDAGGEASGPHDFTVRVSTVRQPTLPASTASRPASVTIAIRPSVGQDGEAFRGDLGQAGTGIFL